MGSKIYDRRGAVQYAKKFAMKYNPNWPSHAGTAGGGGDCTNFVSQALLAGGWPMEDRSAERQGWYSYSNDPGTSRSWAGANPFAVFLKTSRRGRRCRRDELELGDVVQLALNGHVHHTVMVTKVEYAEKVDVPAVFQNVLVDESAAVCRAPLGQIGVGKKIFFVTSHTSDRLDYPLTEWENNGSYDEVVYWKINDVIPESPRPALRSELVRGYP
jgi:putative amidase-like protein